MFINNYQIIKLYYQKKKSYYVKFSHTLHKLPTSSTYSANNPNYIISIVAIKLFILPYIFLNVLISAFFNIVFLY